MGADRFYDEVYQVVVLIPKGRVTSYGAISKYLGTGTARMVGYAMRNGGNISRTFPAHRVVNHAGFVSADKGAAGKKRIQLLMKEGIEMKKAKVIDFKKRFWDPAVELRL